MGKLIFLVLAVVLVWALLKGYRKSQLRNRAPPAAAEDMVRCAHCKVNLPRSESHVSDGQFYCSEEHLKLHR